ncbi:unnamed protein product [Tenebrio molitor]|nr:unnamed protein product [Tenebrio molitor]
MLRGGGTSKMCVVFNANCDGTIIYNNPVYRDIFLTLNIVHTYSLCSILKNTDQCISVAM